MNIQDENDVVFKSLEGIESKQCLKCKEIKSLDDFNKSPKEKFGVSGYCRLCMKIYNKERYLNKKQEFIDRANLWNAENKDKIKKYVKKYYKNKNGARGKRPRVKDIPDAIVIPDAIKKDF